MYYRTFSGEWSSMCTCVCKHVEARGRHLISSSIAFILGLETRLLLDMELANLAGLTGQ